MATSSAPQKPLSVHLDLLAFFGFSALGLIGMYLLHGSSHISFWNVFELIGLGFIGICRWSLFVWRILRSRLYLHGVFPRWRRQANRIPVEYLPHMCFLVPTYKEQPWITEKVFQAIAREAKTLAEPVTLLVNSSSDEENAGVRAVLEAEDPGLRSMRLILMTQKDGKRKAMADGLRELAKLNLPTDTVVALMDGDSELAPGTLRQCLPFFRMFPRMGALTTDELPIVKGSPLFSEWFHLRFAQRHYQMCSDSLSHKVMCLTGRFSLFRAEAALHPTFADQLEYDSLEDWLWGRFKFLSGDDKSTWFWLLRRRYDMLYIPDALVYSIETISGSVIDRAYQNMRRWYGNMLRSNGRAIALGPKVTSWFIWYNLLDQRISIWTSLLTPGFLLVALLEGNWKAAGLVVCWILFSRPLMLAIIFLGRASHLKPIHLPLLLITQWSSSLVKIWTQMNLAKQSWTNRGNQSITAEGAGVKRLLKLGTSRFLLFAQMFSFAVFLCCLAGLLNPVWDLTGLWLQPSAERVAMVIEASDRGVIADDGRDDAVALQKLIRQIPSGNPAQIQLPLGQLDFFQPLEINQSNITLKGWGVARTIIQAQFNQNVGEAVLIVRPQKVKTVAPMSNHPNAQAHRELHHVQLSGFTLRQAAGGERSTVNGILLDGLSQSSVKNLYLERGNHLPLILNQTQDITVEYVTIEDNSTPTGLVLRDAQNTKIEALTLPSSTAQGSQDI
jgi:mannuronan synthase